MPDLEADAFAERLYRRGSETKNRALREALNAVADCAVEETKEKKNGN